ncbi:MAG: hypothetical protein AVDCRST_MAG39-548 [uncultured Sphingomonadaceae bacterium]|uniref:Uncharacterized protein n=1 Tax=uncultured Sphingomonadaceae bacterium TaxID=169976 RepID=A0A6J4S1R1_9SPHN|nr:MAG: hypothetical protein AVDCRST_MAG39-548 [uncultured Sphingomonadaceae bacterium]
MTKHEEYTAKAADSLAAAQAATTARDRAHHQRAHGIWRKLLAGIGESEARAAAAPSPKIKPLKPSAATKPFSF